MLRQLIVKPKAITTILLLQFIPLILFPPSSFSLSTQEWWLPVLLALMVLVAVVQLIFLHSVNAWPWYLMSFAQGFNIISRLMMLMPHATFNRGGAQFFNAPYVILTILSIVISGFFLWYTELAEVRLSVVHD